MVSVIVPIYKVEDYLKRCIDSIVEQTYENLEIILVDDGSPDNCGAICDEYAKQDSRIKVIHKENGGLSSARNAGIRVATGEYISFIDSDDWVEKDFIQKLREALVRENSDMSACLFCRIKENEGSRTEFNENIEVITDEKFYNVLSVNSYAGYATNKLFKRDIIINNNLLFDEKIFNGEDFPFTLEYTKFVNKVSFIKLDLYYYFFRETSIMQTISLSKRFLSLLYAREKALKILSENSPEYYDMCKASYLSILIKVKYMSMSDKKKYEDIYNDVTKKIKDNKKGILKLKNVGIKERVKLFVMISFPKIMSKIYLRKVKIV